MIGRAWALAALLLVAAAAVGPRATAAAAESTSELQARISRAAPGDVIDLAGTVHEGPIRVDRPITLRGGTIDGRGRGTAFFVAAPGARIERMHVRNSGTDVGAPDACIFVEKSATGAVLVDNTLSDCAFGIWVHETDRAEIARNRVEGRDGVRQADRGNGIHLFNASNLVVRANTVHGVRDGVYVSATEDSLIEGNVASNVRFGIHYMYSYRNEILANETNDNTIGIALMESRHLVVEDNRAARNVRQGLLFRDVQDSRIRRNRLERNGNGMFFYSSVDNVVVDNEVLDNEMGLKVWAGTRRNRMEGNVIRGNREQVFYVGAEDQIWGESGRGNHWGDYLGWDQDADGVGDRPHRVDSFTAGLLYRYPSAVLLLRSPALETIAHLADALPMLRTPTIVDRAPLVAREDP